MNSISFFLFGFLFSFLGSISPSMLNMTALKISLENGKKGTCKYAFGVSLIVILQAYIAVFLTKYISENQVVLEYLEKFGIGIFIFLSFYFYRESKKSKLKKAITNVQKETPFLEGIFLSILNMFSIPFFCVVISILEAFSLFSFRFTPVLFFVLGSVIGTFYILFLYGKYAKKIQNKTGKLTKEINGILSIITALVAFFSAIKFF
ncbi:MAG: LysE family transporter [Polaribacter sp.]|jgi:threonine/homoserine/homoserine lactone efflux protein|nr:LysE family transporter [Polaribacter sp.]